MGVACVETILSETTRTWSLMILSETSVADSCLILGSPHQALSQKPIGAIRYSGCADMRPEMGMKIGW